MASNIHVEAHVVAHSINTTTKSEAVTVKVVMPQVILKELRTHRILFDSDPDLTLAYAADIPSPTSMNAGSSRATPVKTMLERVRKDPYIPMFFENQRGMQPGTRLDGERLKEAEASWRRQLESALVEVERLAELGVSKQEANRLLEPFMHVEVLLTATEWKNFLMLRTHQDAQYEIRLVACAIRDAIEWSEPKELKTGQWHLPHVSESDVDICRALGVDVRKVSAARNARVSINSFTTGKPSTPDEDLALYEKLVGATPRHFSPLEHVLRAEPKNERFGPYYGWKSFRMTQFPVVEAGGDRTGA